MPATRAAIADNLLAVFPDAPLTVRERMARRTLKAYARDTIDLIRSLSLSERDASDLFHMSEAHRALLRDVLALGRGAILVTGHYGNWEIGTLLMRRVLKMPMTIVAMAEASAEVNDVRRDIRDRLGADTIEVRQSLDTALQIRRRLAENSFVAMLIDRHLGRDRVPVTLFERRAWFLRTPALVSYLAGAPLLPCFINRTERRPAFAMRLCDPIMPATDRPRDEAVQQAAQRVADQLADRIRQHPEYWYQFYRYWDAQRDAYDGLL
jgi:KDO2-lipid IV(A) lauroyltransferase